jgi:hypothetical protein
MVSASTSVQWVAVPLFGSPPSVRPNAALAIGNNFVIANEVVATTESGVSRLTSGARSMGRFPRKVYGFTFMATAI